LSCQTVYCGIAAECIWVADLPPKPYNVENNKELSSMEISDKISPVSNKNIIKAFEKPLEKPVTPTTKSDRVVLSPQAQELMAAQEAIKQMADVDEEKVAAIKAQIKAGTYKVDSRKVAGSMLAESLVNDTK
jgi:flagellar biosynthesis anti-sigma factor FlgM